ncbi:MAG: hypothetical protein VCA12_12720 [Pseudomonadales bacterium]
MSEPARTSLLESREWIATHESATAAQVHCLVNDFDRATIYDPFCGLVFLH